MLLLARTMLKSPTYLGEKRKTMCRDLYCKTFSHFLQIRTIPELKKFAKSDNRLEGRSIENEFTRTRARNFSCPLFSNESSLDLVNEKQMSTNVATKHRDI